MPFRSAVDEGVAVLLANIVSSSPSRYVPRDAIQLLVDVLLRSQASIPPPVAHRPTIPPPEATALARGQSTGRLHLSQSATIAAGADGSHSVVPGATAGADSMSLSEMRAEAVVSKSLLL